MLSQTGHGISDCLAWTIALSLTALLASIKAGSQQVEGTLSESCSNSYLIGSVIIGLLITIFGTQTQKRITQHVVDIQLASPVTVKAPVQKETANLVKQLKPKAKPKLPVIAHTHARPAAKLKSSAHKPVRFFAALPPLKAIKPVPQQLPALIRLPQPRLKDIPVVAAQIPSSAKFSEQHTTEGKGRHTNLSEYLKELNQRIKLSWSPPRGQTRETEILFRLSHAGKLVSISVVNSSGDRLADQAAAAAVVAAVDMGPLPQEFAPQYLDLRYSFRYHMNQLSELTASRL